MKQLDRWDAVCAAGVALAAYGLYLVYPPAAYIATGALLVFIGFVRAK